MKKLLTGSNEKFFTNKKSGKDKRLNEIREGLISKADEKDFNEFKKLMKSEYEKAFIDYPNLNKEQIKLNYYIFYLWNKCNNLERDLKRDKLERISLDFMDISSNLKDFISEFGEIKNSNVEIYISDFSNISNNKTLRFNNNKFDISFSIVKSFLKQREYYLSKAIFIQESLLKGLIKANKRIIELTDNRKEKEELKIENKDLRTLLKNKSTASQKYTYEDFKQYEKLYSENGYSWKVAFAKLQEITSNELIKKTSYKSFKTTYNERMNLK